jgi:hypothetical protein
MLRKVWRSPRANQAMASLNEEVRGMSKTAMTTPPLLPGMRNCVPIVYAFAQVYVR